LAREAASLHPLPIPSTDPVAVRPQRRPLRARRCQLEYLTLLKHVDHSLSGTDCGVAQGSGPPDATPSGRARAERRLPDRRLLADRAHLLRLTTDAGAPRP